MTIRSLRVLHNHPIAVSGSRDSTLYGMFNLVNVFASWQFIMTVLDVSMYVVTESLVEVMITPVVSTRLT